MGYFSASDIVDSGAVSVVFVVTSVVTVELFDDSGSSVKSTVSSLVSILSDISPIISPQEERRAERESIVTKISIRFLVNVFIFFSINIKSAPTEADAQKTHQLELSPNKTFYKTQKHVQKKSICIFIIDKNTHT